MRLHDLLSFLSDNQFSLQSANSKPTLDRELYVEEVAKQIDLCRQLYFILQEVRLEALLQQLNISDQLLRPAEQHQADLVLAQIKLHLEGYLKFHQRLNDPLEDPHSDSLDHLKNEIVDFILSNANVYRASKAELHKEIVSPKHERHVVHSRRLATLKDKIKKLHWGWHVAALLGIGVGVALIITALVFFPPAAVVIPLISVSTSVKVLALIAGVIAVASSTLIHTIRIARQRTPRRFFARNGRQSASSPPPLPSPLQQLKKPRRSSGTLSQWSENGYLSQLLTRWRAMSPNTAIEDKAKIRCLVEVRCYAERLEHQEIIASTQRELNRFRQKSAFHLYQDWYLLESYGDQAPTVSLDAYDLSEDFINKLNASQSDFDAMKLKLKGDVSKQITTIIDNLKELNSEHVRLKDLYSEKPGNFHLHWLAESHRLLSSIMSEAEDCLRNTDLPLRYHTLLWELLELIANQKKKAVDLQLKQHDPDARERSAALILQDFQRFMSLLKNNDEAQNILVQLKLEQSQQMNEAAAKSEKIEKTILDSVSAQYIGGGQNWVFLLNKENQSQKQHAIMRVYNFEEQLQVIKAIQAIKENWQHEFLGGVFAEFQTDIALYQLGEYFHNGSLADHIKKNQQGTYKKDTIDSNNFLKHTQQIISIIQKLHYHHPPIVFTDMKPANFYLDNQFNIVLSDLKSIYQLNDEQITQGVFPGDLPFTPEYAAPEITNHLNERNARYDPLKADSYALGITLCEYLTGSPDINQLSKFKPSIDIQWLLYVLVKGLTQANPRERFDIDTVQKMITQFLNDPANGHAVHCTDDVAAAAQFSY